MGLRVVIGPKRGSYVPSARVITFNTATHEFKKKEDFGELNFLGDYYSPQNQAFRVCNDTVFALVHFGRNVTCRATTPVTTQLIKYSKGDTCLTEINF